MNVVKAYWREWNPKRLRRLLAIKDMQIQNNANGWANTHQQLLQAKKEIEQLKQQIGK